MVDVAAAAAAAAGAGLVGGAMNALAGGGTFVTMPTLVALGLPAPVANATSNVALQPGALASAWAYRSGLGPIGGVPLRTLGWVNFVGGAVGSLLLVLTPARTFDLVVPWLLLLATGALALGRGLAERFRAALKAGPGAVIAAQALLGAYGGYFGGAVGIISTAIWGLLTGMAPHQVAGQRTLMLALANTAAATIFIAAGMVAWTLALPMLVGAVTGGYLGARLARLLPPAAIRIWTLAVSATMTALFFWRAYS